MIVGLIGRRQAGKDTAALALAKDGFYNIKFSDGLKIMLRALLRSLDFSDKTTERLIDGDLKEQPLALLGDKSPRYLMQTLGTEWGRDLVGENLWVNIAIDRCRQFPNVVVTDVRHSNEAKAIHRAGGILIRIERRADQRNEVDAHSSEALMDGILSDYLVLNAGTIEDLQEKVRHLVSALRK